jgi:predicted dehydrogenase
VLGGKNQTSRRSKKNKIMANTELKIAFVGCGNIAKEHLKGIKKHVPHLKVTAMVDSNLALATAMAHETAARPFDSLAAALAEGDFEAVDIMLPHHLHEQAAVMAFAAGKHVLLEKPMAPTLDACDHILQAARAAGRVFMVAEQAEYWPDAVTVQHLIQTGAIGEVLTARAYFGNPYGLPQSPLPEPKPWRFYLAQAGGGITIDGGAHWLRPLRMWLGEIEAVVAASARPIADVEGETLLRALLRFRSGAIASFDAVWAGAFMGAGDEFRVTGTLGEIIIEKGNTGRVLLYNAQHPTGEVLMVKGDGRSDAFGYELRDFTNAVLNGSALKAGPAYALGELRTALAMYRSAQTGRWEQVWGD